MDNPNYTANPVNRCYFCKSELHDTLKPLATQLGYVVDGVNADDLRDYRPGIQAAKERGCDRLGKWVLLKPKYANSPNIWVCLGGINPRNLLEFPLPYGEEITVGKLQQRWDEQSGICGRWD